MNGSESSKAACTDGNALMCTANMRRICCKVWVKRACKDCNLGLVLALKGHGAYLTQLLVWMKHVVMRGGIAASENVESACAAICNDISAGVGTQRQEFSKFRRLTCSAWMNCGECLQIIHPSFEDDLPNKNTMVTMAFPRQWSSAICGQCKPYLGVWFHRKSYLLRETMECKQTSCCFRRGSAMLPTEPVQLRNQFLYQHQLQTVEAWVLFFGWSKRSAWNSQQGIFRGHHP